jgi:hypothetical protein
MKHGQAGFLSMLTIVVLVLVVGFMAFVFLPVYHDREIRGLAVAGVVLAKQVAERLPAAPTGSASQAAEGAQYLPGGSAALPAHIEKIQVTKEGTVRLTFKSPSELAGKAIEIRTFPQGGKLVRECRGAGIKDGYLPGSCRHDADPIPVESPK